MEALRDSSLVLICLATGPSQQHTSNTGLTYPTGFYTGQEGKTHAKKLLEDLSDTAAAAALSPGGVLDPSL